jgi:hypothetical protein
MMEILTYDRKMVAHYGSGYVIVPDQVAEDQKGYDIEGTPFPAIPCDTAGRSLNRRMVKVRIDGNAYGLWTSVTGDMRVRKAR